MARLVIQRTARGEDPVAWRAALEAFDRSRATVLKREGGNAVYRARVMGREVVIKVRESRGLKELLKRWAGSSRGARHWRGAAWLIEHGILTARPFALATDGAREWLVLEALKGKTLLQHIADRDLTVKEEHEVARRLGRQMSDISLTDRFNRDHKPSNIILVRGTGGYSPAVIDCVAIRRGLQNSWRMMHALAVEPLGLGILPRRALRARVIYEFCRAWFEGEWERAPGDGRRRARLNRRMEWRILEGSLRKHGDPVPRVNPLDAEGE
jgi:tRNA A-37 threonylcarbamoyl transferase component Bud32